MGLTGSTPTINAPNPGQVGQSFNGMLADLYGSTPGQLNEETTYLPGFTNAATSNLNTAAGGVLDTYLNSIIPGLNLGNLGITSGNVGTVGATGPAAAGAVAGINPGTADLTNLLTGAAGTSLKAAATGVLPAAQADATLNAVNQNWASRGMGGQPGNALDAALNYYNAGETNLNNAEAAASGAINTGYNTVTAPALGLATSGATTPGGAMGFTGATPGSVASASYGSLPSTPDIESLLNTIYNAQAGSNIAQGNAQEAQNALSGEVYSGLIGGGASMIGGL